MSTDNNKNNNIGHLDRIKKATASIDAAKKYVENGIYRNRYHMMPEAYWMNDPNGFIYFKGKYHLYYQTNPFSTVWANMHWAHVVSEDLINWEHRGVALAPSNDYDDDLKGGTWSGTAVEHEGKIYILYTCCVMKGDVITQQQCLAYSEDGDTFTKYEGNPVLQAPEGLSSADFRDPKIWKHGNDFYCIVSSKNDGEACLGIFQSKDMKSWEYKGIFFHGHAAYGEMWECPDFFKLDNRYVLQVCTLNYDNGIKSMCFVGSFDYEKLRFEPVEIYESDAGFDFYGAQTAEGPNKERIMVGYTNSWPWMPWFKDFGLNQFENWCGSLGLPREMNFNESGRLVFKPIDAVYKLQGDITESRIYLRNGERKDFKIGDGIHAKLDLKFNLNENKSGLCKIHLRNSALEDTVILVDFVGGKIICDRTRSYKDLSSVLFGNTNNRQTRVARTFDKQKSDLRVEIFADTSCIEVYVNDGETVLTFNLFPELTSTGCFIEAENSDIIVSINASSMGSAKC